jgi:hypothetical protein
MRWTLKQSDRQLILWQFEANETSGHLKYNKQAHSFRFSSAGDQRLFFLERTGFLQHRYLLRTEYSVVTGEIYPAKNGHKGIAIMEGKKFNYALNGKILNVSSKKQRKTFSIEISDPLNPDLFELYALLSATLRMITNTYKLQPEPAFVS